MTIMNIIIIIIIKPFFFIMANNQYLNGVLLFGSFRVCSEFFHSVNLKATLVALMFFFELNLFCDSFGTQFL